MQHGKSELVAAANVRMTMQYNDSIARAYARNRTTNAIIIDELCAFAPLSPVSRVLEVGCGTASHLIELVNSTGCYGWGVEPSDGMRRLAVSHERLELATGSAEELPFGPCFFELVFSVNVIHHVPDHLAHFREAKRVIAPTGMICTATDSAEMIRNRKPLSQYWPSSAEADMKRYSTVESLLDSMRQVGFVELATREISSEFVVTDSTPYRDKAFSCLHMISDAEFEDGLAILESDLEKGPIAGSQQYACIWGKGPVASRPRRGG